MNAAPIASRLVLSLAVGTKADDEGHDHHQVRASMASSERAEPRSTSHHHGDDPDHPPDERELSDIVTSQTTIAAPCQCGCDERAGTPGVSDRLGPIILASADPAPVSGSAPAQHWLIQHVRDTPPSLPDPIPITT
jgi:hypothetical protein